MICSEKQCFSSEAIRRLAQYYQALRVLIKNDVEVISSADFARLVHVTPEQFRKDLSYFGEFGRRGVGYETARLRSEIERILGLDRPRLVALIGVGQLGGALLNYPGFLDSNLVITKAFDANPAKIGTLVNGIEVENISDFESSAGSSGIELCILCVPSGVVNEVSQTVVKAGIRAILNFSPVFLDVPDNVHVTNIDMASEIGRLAFLLDRTS